MTDSCRAVRALLPGLQGPSPELTLDEAARVRAHVAGCPACQSELQRTLAAGRLVGRLASADTPVPTLEPTGLVERLVRRRFTSRVVAGTLAVLMTGAVGWMALRPIHGSRLDATEYWIGAVVVSLPAGAAEVPAGVPLDPPGYYVGRLIDGPARDAGLQIGDRIIAVDGMPVAGPPISVLPPTFRPGDRIELTVLRGDQRFAVGVWPVSRRSPGGP